jgi:hypothetical protein
VRLQDVSFSFIAPLLYCSIVLLFHCSIFQPFPAARAAAEMETFRKLYQFN